jgi:ASTRA-associated protein 1
MVQNRRTLRLSLLCPISLNLLWYDFVLGLHVLSSSINAFKADVWEIPSQKRLHAAVGKSGAPAPSESDGRSVINPIGTPCLITPQRLNSRSAGGIIMSMHLFYGPPSEQTSRKLLRLLCGYENGSVTLREYRHNVDKPSIDGIGWDVLWTVKLHVESGTSLLEHRFRAAAHARQ